MERIEVRPELLRWARDRSGLTADEFDSRFPRFAAWESGEPYPTLKQLQSFAARTYTPFGLLLLDAPPEEPLPIADFREGYSGTTSRPSSRLLDTIYGCQQRQDWYHTYALANDVPSVDFVGEVSEADDALSVASAMRSRLSFDEYIATGSSSWDDVLRRFRRRLEEVGILVMSNGVVGNNPHRALDPNEFRGFSLADSHAPLIFVNSKDSKAAQMFTLSHELAHLWAGSTGLSNAEARSTFSPGIETWCNQVAAEFLVPTPVFYSHFSSSDPLEEEVIRLSRLFKVSTLVILRRLLDVGIISREQFRVSYEYALANVTTPAASDGGDFYRVLNVRVGTRFGRALVASTLEGNTTYSEALSLLNLTKMETFLKFARWLGFNV